jgi:hypothetical protein
MLDVLFDDMSVDLRRNVFVIDEVIKTVESVFKLRTFIRINRKKSDEFLIFYRVNHDET